MSDMFGLDKPLPETSEAAALEIDVIFADKNHPYHAKPDHPLRKQAQTRVTKLFEIRAGEPILKSGEVIEDSGDIERNHPVDFVTVSGQQRKFQELVCG